MATRDPRVDAYIAKSADFAHPILTQIRDIVHEASPDVEEAIKWGCPHFMYKGMLCAMAAFKGHCKLHFWRAALVLGDDVSAGASERLERITSVDELPARATLTRYVQRAMALNDGSVDPPARARTGRRGAPRPAPEPPADLVEALRRNAAAQRFFSTLSPSQQREYVEWITEAKTAPTRDRRVATAAEWLAEGKTRNWKYVRARA